jgi:uncharacterized metal-binding protein YceD (DUF177 family)
MKKPRLSEPVWTAAVAVADVPETGTQLKLATDASVRAGLAKLAGVVALPRVEAAFELTRQGPDGLHVVGRVTADVEQNCVVTLEPMVSQLDELVDMVFLPRRDAPDAGETEQIGTLDEADPPELMADGTVDLGALATEFLLLGIDPYPRKPGAAFDSPVAEQPGANPFAQLAALKAKLDRGTP